MDVHELEVENAPDGIGGKDPTLGGTSAQMSRDLDSGAGDAFEDGHFAFKDTGSDAFCHTPTLCRNRWYVRGVLGTGVATAGSNGAEVRGVAMVLTQDGDVTGTDADVISQAGQTGIIIGGCRFWKQEQSSLGFGVSI